MYSDALKNLIHATRATYSSPERVAYLTGDNVMASILAEFRKFGTCLNLTADQNRMGFTLKEREDGNRRFRVVVTPKYDSYEFDLTFHSEDSTGGTAHLNMSLSRQVAAHAFLLDVDQLREMAPLIEFLSEYMEEIPGVCDSFLTYAVRNNINQLSDDNIIDVFTMMGYEPAFKTGDHPFYEKEINGHKLGYKISRSSFSGHDIALYRDTERFRQMSLKHPVGERGIRGLVSVILTDENNFVRALKMEAMVLEAEDIRTIKP